MLAAAPGPSSSTTVLGFRCQADSRAGLAGASSASQSETEANARSTLRPLPGSLTSGFHPKGARVPSSLKRSQITADVDFGRSFRLVSASDGLTREICTYQWRGRSAASDSWGSDPPLRNPGCRACGETVGRLADRWRRAGGQSVRGPNGVAILGHFPRPR
jgi:hypothetical protein